MKTTKECWEILSAAIQLKNGEHATIGLDKEGGYTWFLWDSDGQTVLAYEYNCAGSYEDAQKKVNKAIREFTT